MTRLFAWALLVTLALDLSAGEKLIPEQSPNWRHAGPSLPAGDAWKQSSFNDSAWPLVPSPLGYGNKKAKGALPPHKIAYALRHSFQVQDPAALKGLLLEFQVDDGAVFYLNGREVHRVNLPLGPLQANTAASEAKNGDQRLFLSPEVLVKGTNVLAVDLRNQHASSSDIFLDLSLQAETGLELVRGPYLQLSGPATMAVRWRTNLNCLPQLALLGPDGKEQILPLPSSGTEHEIRLKDLKPDSSYSYRILDANGQPFPEAQGSFRTHPKHGQDKAIRVWIIGDAGTANNNQKDVFDAFTKFNEGQPIDLFLMLGDNAYYQGSDKQYQAAVFDMYKPLLRHVPTWSCLGNHENDYGNRGVYFDIFSFPGNAASEGFSTGVDSGTEAYHSFDYGPVHFVCVDSSSQQDYSPQGAMYQWLERDLQQNTGRWVIAYWHHPPYTKGTHDSDRDPHLELMRTNFTPLLEKYGVDAAFFGHSHIYERSFFLAGHTGKAETFVPKLITEGGHLVQLGDGKASPYTKESVSKPGDGLVYIVNGSCGAVPSGKGNHPAMAVTHKLFGSVLLEIEGDTLRCRFIETNGVVRDDWSIVKKVQKP